MLCLTSVSQPKKASRSKHKCDIDQHDKANIGLHHHCWPSSKGNSIQSSAPIHCYKVARARAYSQTFSCNKKILESTSTRLGAIEGDTMFDMNQERLESSLEKHLGSTRGFDLTLTQPRWDLPQGTPWR